MRDFSALISFLDNLSVEYEKEAKTAPLVSFRVGGRAKLVAMPTSIIDFCAIIRYLNINKFKYFILCQGTNTYFSKYYDGIVISTRKLSQAFVSDNYLIAYCGASVFKCCELAKENSLSGFEFAYGIPGGIGGGIYMNASAFGNSFSDIVAESLIYDIKSDAIKIITNKEHKFNIKHSIFNDYNYVLLSTTLRLTFSDKQVISECMERILNKRLSSQPIDLPSAGSAFKRPCGMYASKLIDDAKLKGKAFGDAQVSEQHAGFIVNMGNATAENVNSLIKYIKSRILKKFNVKLEEEIIYVE